MLSTVFPHQWLRVIVLGCMGMEYPLPFMTITGINIYTYVYINQCTVELITRVVQCFLQAVQQLYFLTHAVACRFQNVCCYDANHALYSYRDPGLGQKRLAKFTGRYGTAVHAAWASAGLAPALFDVTELQPHSLLVTMELLPECWRVLSDLLDLQLLESKPYVLQALHQAQSVAITMGTNGAHGDMRLPNVAVHLDGQQWHVRFLDFDWAGVAGEHTCPPFMNPKIKWPSGAHACAVMLSEHDATLLQLQFDLAD